MCVRIFVQITLLTLLLTPLRLEGTSPSPCATAEYTKVMDRFHYLFVDDADKDGVDEVVGATISGSSTVRVFERPPGAALTSGFSDGSYGGDYLRFPSNGWANGQGCAVYADLDGDNWLDIVTTAYDNSRVCSWKRTGVVLTSVADNTYNACPVIPGVPVKSLSLVIPGRFNSDARDDLLLGGYENDLPTRIWISHPSSFGNPDVIHLPPGLPNAGRSVVAVLDFNSDGVDDLIYPSESVVQVWINDGDGSSFTQHTVPGAHPFAVLNAGIGDVNQDGYDDAVGAGNGDGSSKVITLVFGGANPGAAGIAFQTIDITPWGTRYGALLGDNNGDGVLDIWISAQVAHYAVLVYLDTPDAQLHSLATSVDFGYVRYMAETPTNCDRSASGRFFTPNGGHDLVCIQHADKRLLTYRNQDGKGMFLPQCVTAPCSTVDCIFNAIDSVTYSPTYIHIDNGVYTQCPSFHKTLVKANTEIILLPSDTANPNVVFDCQSQGVLFSVAGTARLELRDITVRNGGHVGGSPTMLVSGSGVLTLIRTMFVNCSSGDWDGPALAQGGAVYATLNAKLLVVDSVFQANTAFQSGGALALDLLQGAAVIKSSTFVGNVAQSGSGGALFVRSRGASVMDRTVWGDWTTYGSLNMSDSVFDSNRAPWGGALSVLGSQATDPLSPSNELELLLTPEEAVTSLRAQEVFAYASNCTVVGSNAAEYLGRVIYACAARVVWVGGGWTALDDALSGETTVELGACGWGGGVDTIGQVGIDVGIAPFVEGVGVAMWESTSALTTMASLARASPAVGAPVMPGSRLPELVFDILDGLGRVKDESTPLVGLGALTLQDGVGRVTVDEVLYVAQVAVAGRGVFPNVKVSVMDLDDASGSFALTAAFVQDESATSPALALVPPAGGSGEERVDLSFVPCRPGWGRVETVTLFEPIACGLCPPASYSPEESMAPCAPFSPCHTNSERVGNMSLGQAGRVSDEPCVCRPGFWTPLFEESNNIDVCAPCPRGGVCEGGSSRPYPAPGFFDVSDSNGVVFAACPYPNACADVVTSGCAPGYEGTLCATCQDGWFVERDEGCRKCEGHQIPLGYILSAALVIVPVILMAVLVVVHARQTRRRVGGLDETDEEEWSGMARLLRLGAVPYSIRILFFHVQLLGVLGDAPLKWRSPGREVLDAMSVATFSVNVTGVSCMWDWTTRYVYPLVAPLVLAGVWTGCMGVARALSLPVATWATYVRVMLGGATMLLVPVAKASLVHFACMQLDDGSWRMVIDVGRRCYDQAWMDLLPVALVAVVFYVCIVPGTMAVLTFRARHRLFSSRRTLETYGVLYSSLRSSAYMWESVAVMVRIVAVGATLFLHAHPEWLIIVVQIVFALYAYAMLRVSPLYLPSLNKLESMLDLSLVAVAAFGGIMLYNDSGSEAILTGASIMVIVLVATSLGYALVLTFREFGLRRLVVASVKEGGVVGGWDVRRRWLFGVFEEEMGDWGDLGDARELRRVWQDASAASVRAKASAASAKASAASYRATARDGVSDGVGGGVSDGVSDDGVSGGVSDDGVSVT